MPGDAGHAPDSQSLHGDQYEPFFTPLTMTRTVATLGQHGSLFESQAKVYSAYRPGYPELVFETIYAFAGLTLKQVAVDIGCGTGQVAVGLAQDFEQVLGLDSAQAQIQHAAARPNIIYRVAPAEATRLEAQSVDLVVAAQCMHWFDIPAFYRECRRILRPRGSLAVFGYMPTKVYFPDSTEAGEVLNRLHAKLHHYFHEKRQRFFLQHYEGQVPTGEDFEVVETTIINMERHLSIEQLVGWVRSMSGWASYKEQHGEASMERVLHQLQADLLQALCLTNEHTPVVSVWPLTTILAKQPVPVE